MFISNHLQFGRNISFFIIKIYYICYIPVWIMSDLLTLCWEFVLRTKERGIKMPFVWILRPCCHTVCIHKFQSHLCCRHICGLWHFLLALSSTVVIIIICNHIIVPWREAGDFWCFLPPPPPISRISGLSFDSTLLSPLSFFCWVLLLFLSCLLFSACWPILLTFFSWKFYLVLWAQSTTKDYIRADIKR